MTGKQAAATRPGHNSGRGGVYTHAAAIPPEALVEANRWLDEACGSQPIPPLLIVVGLAEGHLLDVVERRAPATKVLALEPDRTMADLAAARRGWSGWRSSGRLLHLVNPDYAGADEAWRLFPRKADDCVLMVNPRLDAGHPATGAAARVAQKILQGVKANAEARRQFAPRYLTNVIRNVPAIVGGRDLRALTNAFLGVPAVIAAAGPSLDAAMGDLAGITNRALLIAVDTALRPLLDAGIAPQLVAALDPGLLNARHFQHLQSCPETWLVAESALDRSATRLFDERTFWLRVSNHQPWPWLVQSGIDVGQIDVWGSVLTAAFQIACLAGCEPIVFVGADLAFTGGQPYCRGTTYEFDWAWSAAVGRSLEQAWQHHIDSTRPRISLDLHGRQTISSGSMESFRDWIVARAKKSGRRVINATGAGILFGDGVEQGTLTSGVGDRISVPSMRMVAADASAGNGRRNLTASVADVRRRLAAGARESSPLAEWIEFSGDSFDADALEAALAEAAETIFPATVPPAPASPVPRAGASDLAGQGGLLTRLPESMARLRGALGDGTPPEGTTEVAGPAPAALVVKALRVLDEVRGLVSSRDLAFNSEPRLWDPASNAYAWPESARWAVETFEALLGRAWGRATFSPADGPLTGQVKRRSRALSASDPPGPASGACGDHACLLLALEWLRCAASQGEGPALALSSAIDRVRAMAEAARPTSQSTPEATAAVLVLDARHGDSSHTVELPLPASRAALARALTGAIEGAGGDGVALALVATDELDAAVSVRFSDPPPASRGAVQPRMPGRLAHPRLLTSEMLTRASVFYEAGDCAIGVVPHARTSFSIGSEGAIRAHHAWPRPIVGELALPGGRLAAWGFGPLRAPHAAPGYVMYRTAHDAAPSIEELPFRPVFAIWWDDRLYFTCFPGGHGDPMGLGSWAPGGPARLDLVDIAVFGVHPAGGALHLHPGHRTASGFERSLMTEATQWRPDGSRESIPLSPLGSASCTTTAHSWTATAYPEADVIRFESADGGVLTMTCYYCFRLAWAGRSLVVSTFERELFLFENLVDLLEAGRP